MDQEDGLGTRPADGEGGELVTRSWTFELHTARPLRIPKGLSIDS
jgi:hypothetical protein